MPLKIAIELEQGAWARCTFRPARRSHEVTISYDSDGIAQFLIAAIAVLTGYQTLSFTFQGVQAEWLFTAKHNSDSGKFDFEISEFFLSFSSQDFETRSIVHFSCQSFEFGKAVFDAVSTVLNKNGVKVYNEIWSDYPFPKALHEYLRTLVNSKAHDA